MDQSFTMNTFQKTKRNNHFFTKILSIFILIIGIVASFTHRLFLPADNNPKIIALNEEKKLLEEKWDKKEFLNDSLFKNNSITKEEYFIIKDLNKKVKSADFRRINNKRKTYVEDFSFNGRSSLHYWLWVFGSFISLLICSCYLALKDAKLKSAGLLKWYEPYAGIGFISVSLFWLYHTIFNSTGYFGYSLYILFVVLFIPLSYFVYHSLRRMSINIEDKLLENIQDLVSHVLRHTKKDKEKEKWELLDKISKNGR